jgi:hypothetical protein
MCVAYQMCSVMLSPIGCIFFVAVYDVLFSFHVVVFDLLIVEC